MPELRPMNRTTAGLRGHDFRALGGKIQSGQPLGALEQGIARNRLGIAVRK